MNVFDLVAVLSLNKKGYEEGLDSAEKEASSFGSKVKSGLGTVAKVGGASLAILGTGATAVTKSLLSTSAATAELGDHIDKQSQKIGISAQAYQEWDFILTHNGASVDSLQSAMKTLSSQAEKNADEFTALGITEEELQNMSPEELFERTVKALQGMGESTERTAIASKLLGRSATELGPVFNSTSEDIEEMRQQAHDLGKVLSDDTVKAGAAYEDSLYNLQTSIGGIKNKMASDFLPSIVQVMDGLTGMFSGDDSAVEKLSAGIDSLATKITQAIPKIAEVASKIITTFGKAIIENLPKITKSAVGIVKTLISTITENLPMIFDMGIDIIMALIDGLIDSLPDVIDGLIYLVVRVVERLPEIILKLVEALPRVIEMLIEGLITNLPILIQGAINLVLELVNHLPEIMMGLIEALPRIIEMVITGLIENLPLLVQGAIQLVIGLVTHLPEIISGLIAAIPSIISSIVSAFGPLGGLLGDVFGGALDICGGILGELGNIAQGVFNWIGTLMDDPAKAIEDAFDGIKDYASNVFSSLKTIAQGIFDLIDEAERRKQSEEVGKRVAEEKQKLVESGDMFIAPDGRVFYKWNKDEYDAYMAANYGQTSEASYSKKEEKVEVGGTIRVEGVDPNGNNVETYDYIIDHTTGMMRRQARMVG